ncbi:unnamed protein product [Cylicostephanus goldi]|uniref:Uncharacterized protein n=1 Tax=Cylicostephanus goldi TaxID=71465 RepID=A0A3P6RWJ4_CYLGO|nr:unnamed protein product [Cylicostephanus goldi]
MWWLCAEVEKVVLLKEKIEEMEIHMEIRNKIHEIHVVGDGDRYGGGGEEYRRLAGFVEESDDVDEVRDLLRLKRREQSGAFVADICNALFCLINMFQCF